MITLKLVKKEELTGEVWFRIWQNDTCVKSFKQIDEHDAKTKEEAVQFYDDMKERLKNGYPKTETILSDII